ncbi:MAG TPA: hypothetical protein VMJ10_28360 [Kofleriaceae bacterium]|nr:hypothetical protein [Kofleriaceae bacterium]
MKISRRNLLATTLFGAGYAGLRALATGLPLSVFVKGARRAFADGSACADSSKAQYFILSTSAAGDPINANCPGAYGVSGVYNCQDPTMKPLPMSLGSVQTTAATPWTLLPTSVTSRMSVWHIMTNTPVHPKEGDVLRLSGATQANEMLPSLLAKQLAPCLNTVQTQPITVGANSPSEALSFDGAPLPILPPLALQAMLTAPQSPLTNLTGLRDQTLSKLDDLYRSSATPAQSKYLDSLITSQQQVRNINQSLLDLLSSIQDNTVTSQITAAMALFQMNVTPVVAINIPFGGDNHHDTGLANEAAGNVSGVATIGQVIAAIPSTLADKVTFMSLNVFGRTLGSSSVNGRQHNPNHQVSITIGSQFNAGIVGGIGPVQNDFGCLDIDSTSGLGQTGADIAAIDSLASYGKTLLASVGVTSSTYDTLIPNGKVVQAALK